MTNTKDIDKIVAKIQKMLALANNNPCEEEALTAMKMARTMLAKYNLSMAEVEGLDVDDDSTNVVQDTINGKNSYKRWEIMLAAVLEEFVPIRILQRSCYSGNRRVKRIVFVGDKVDVVVAQQMFEYLRKTVQKMASKASTAAKKEQVSEELSIFGFQPTFNKSRYKKSYCVGAVDRLRSRFIELKKKDEDNIEQAYALVVQSKSEKVDQFIEEEMNVRQARRSRSSIDHSAYSQGHREAAGIGLSSQVGTAGVAAGSLQ